MLAALGAMFGAFIGSFLNVCVHRLPRNESVVQPSSRCYGCGTRVQWYDNLPIIGWLVLRGRCRWCGTAFSVRYLVMEIAVAALTALVVALTFAGPLLTAPWLRAFGVPLPAAQAAAAAALLTLVYVLVVSAVIDLDHMIIPDELSKGFQVVAPWLAVAAAASLGYGWDGQGWLWRKDTFGALIPTYGRFVAIMLGIGLGSIVLLMLTLPLARWIYGSFCPEAQRWSEDDHHGLRVGAQWFALTLLPPLIAIAVIGLVVPPYWRSPGDLVLRHLGQAVLGSITGWWSLYLVGLIGTVAFRRNAMGFGDVKFLAPVGAFLGPIGVLYAFFGAAVVGTVVGLPLRLFDRRREIPFGPYLALGALLALVIGPTVHRWLFP